MHKQIKAILIKATSEELEFDKACQQLKEIDLVTGKEYEKGGLEYAVLSGYLTLSEVMKLVDFETYSDLEDTLGITKLTQELASFESSLYQCMDYEDTEGVTYYSQLVSNTRAELNHVLDTLGGEI